MSFVVGVAILIWAIGTLGGLYFGVVGASDSGFAMMLMQGLFMGALGCFVGGLAGLFSLPFTMLLVAFVSS